MLSVRQRMHSKQHAISTHACLLALPSYDWDGTNNCPGVNPAVLKSGRVADRYWQLLHWQPQGPLAATLHLRWSDVRQSRLDMELLP